MYKKEDPRQMELECFSHPFNGALDKSNRWVQMAEMIPWEKLEKLYVEKMNKNWGRPCKSFRMALGAMIIKHKLNLSDEETVDQIRENVYMQYFIGLEEFTNEPPFDSSMMVHFRKRMDFFDISKINDLTVGHIEQAFEDKEDQVEDDDDEHRGDDSGAANKGKLVIDATVAPADITYPTDLKLLNHAREKAEKIFDVLWGQAGYKDRRKPRTYRKKARADFLKISKKRNCSRKGIKKGIKKQLQYLKRDLGFIKVFMENRGGVLDKTDTEKLEIIRQVYSQQRQLHESGKKSIPKRIVSLAQPHVRPMVRGKARAKTEFGAKISMSLVNGLARIDRLDWEAYNESGDLKKQVEGYRKRYGHYPESVHADTIYRTRENRKYLKERGIRLSGPKLGRPEKETPENSERLKRERKQYREDELDRIPVEGKFGEGKRKYGMNLILGKLKETSESWIAMIVLVMNLEKTLRKSLFVFICSLVKKVCILKKMIKECFSLLIRAA